MSTKNTQETVFEKALRVRETHRKNAEKESFSKLNVSPEIKNKSFIENNSSIFINFVKNLGFDTQNKTDTVVFSNKNYYTVNPENSKGWHSSYKSLAIRNHLNSIIKNHRFYKVKTESLNTKTGEIKSVWGEIRDLEISKEAFREVWPKATLKDRKANEEYNFSRKSTIAEKMKEGNCALKSYKNTEMIALDIDTHGFHTKNKEKPFSEFQSLSQSILEFLQTELNLNVVLYERSKVCRGIHCYIRLQSLDCREAIEKILKIALEKQFSEICVEFRSKTKALRLPFSWDYETINLKTFKVQRKFYKKINEAIEIWSLPIIESNRDLLKRIASLTKEETSTEKISAFSTRLKTIVKSKPEWNLAITEGNRVGGQKILWKLVNWSISNNLNFEQFYDECERNNLSSKDLTSWNPQKKNRELRKIWDYSLRNHSKIIQKTSSTNFISNTHFISEKEKEILNFFVDSHYTKSTVWDIKKREETKIIFYELLGKIRFEQSNPRQINSELPISKLKKFELTVGHQFPKEFFNRLSENYSLKTSTKKAFDLFKILFLKSFVHSNGSTYIPSLMSCKQYQLNDRFSYYFELAKSYSTPKHNSLCSLVFFGFDSRESNLFFENLQKHTKKYTNKIRDG